jgi:hypothetical protein
MKDAWSATGGKKAPSDDCESPGNSESEVSAALLSDCSRQKLRRFKIEPEGSNLIGNSTSDPFPPKLESPLNSRLPAMQA